MKKYLILTLFISLGYLLSAQTLPTVNNETVSTLEDNDKVFVVGDFPSYFDADGDPFTDIRIRGLESVGILYYDADGDNIIDAGEDVALWDVILVADIPRLKFRPNPDENGVGYDSFDFQVNDGNDGYSAIRTMTIDVTPVNDEPSFTAGANQTVLEDAGPQNVPNWATAISVGPANEAGQTPSFNVSNNNNGLFSAQPAIDAAGNLTYTSAANASGFATVTVSVSDDGGIANGGDDTSPGQNFTITITAVNDLPTGADNTVSCFENAGVTFAAAHFGYADNDGDAFAQIRVTTVPGLGTLWIDTDNDGTVNGAEVPLASGNVVLIADINASLLKYIPLPGENGSPYTTWDFEVHDGTVYSATSYTMTIDVLPVNSEPSFIIGADQVVNEDAGAQNVVGWATSISAGAADEEPPIQTLTFFVSNNNNGLFSVQPGVDATTGNLTYTPAANIFGVATVTIYLTDDGGTANGGDDTSPSQNFTITVNSVNDAPTSTDNSVNVFENSVLTLVTAHFNYSDVESDPFTQIETTTVPGLGTLWIDTNSDGIINGGEVPLAPGNIVPIADISGNRLKFIPNPNENGSPYTTFDFKVHDGIEFSTLSYTMTINVLAVNSEPSFTKGADQVVNEDAGAQTVAGWATAIDPGGAGEGGQVLTFNVSNSLPALFSVQPAVDAVTGDLTYTPAPNANGVATVSIYLTDDGGTANGGDDTSPTQTFTITVNPVNDVPVVTANNPLNINEGDINQLISTALLEVTDVDNTPAEIEYTITTVPAAGTLKLSGLPLGLNDTYTQADINANALTYSHDGSEGTPDSYFFTVIDGAGGSIGSTQFIINIAPVNDAPIFTSSPVTTGDQLVFYIYNITTTDAEGDPLVIAPVTIPAWLALVDNGDGTATLSGTPPGGTPLNNPITISVSDGIAPPVTQSWNLIISSSVTADAGPDDITCNNNEYTLNATAAPVGYTGTWTVIGGSGVFANANLPNTLVTGLDNGPAPFNTNTFRWTLSNGIPAEDVWDDVVITNNTVVASVTDINNVCGTNAILQADNALNPGETGLWTVEGAPIPLPVIANPNNRTTAVSGLQYNVNQFRWTLTKGTCSDFAIMNVNVIEVYATAGGPAEICSEPFTILGNDPTILGGTGVWTVGAGSGVFANANAPTTTVTGSHQDVQNEYVWTVTVNGCSAQASVFVENNIPTTAVITTPNPSTSCDGIYTISAVPADATDPNETGYWTTVTPGVVITNANLATTGVTGLQEGANLFTWHITNGTCPESTADVTINYFFPPTVDAGPDAIICTDDYNLAATPLDAGETGLWTFTTGGMGSTIINPTSNTTQVINLQSGLNVLQWTVSHDICSSDDVVEITNMSVDAIISTTDPLISCTDPSPLITANIPSSQDIANPATPATGSWSVLSGGSIVDNPLSWNTTVSNLDAGNNDYIWTITNGTCTDTDTITVINSIPTQAYAGKDTIVCSTSLPNLNGNNYNSLVEIGFWRRIAGNATITDISLANTSVTNLDYYCTPWTPNWWTNVAAVNVFEWVIRRGTCESTDQVSVMNGLPETIDAGLDQTVCDNVVNLDALDEASCADDHWWEQLPDVGNYIDPLTGAFIPDNDLNMPFNVHVDNIQDGMTQFVWHKRNNFFDSLGNPIQCELTDTVEITSLGLVEDVQAGPEDATCENWYQLNATNPSTIFTAGPPFDVVSGQWTLIFGAGNFDDDTYYNTTVRNMAAYDNIYRWTVTNLTKGCILTDDVYIHSARPSNATAGPDDVTCNDFAVLSSNVPVRYTSAYWTVAVGGSTIIQNSCTGFTCDAIATNIADSLNIYIWHVVNEYTGGFGGYDAANPLTCEVIDSTVIIYRGVTADAGVDIYECGDFTQLNANDPAWNTGVWTGSGTFDDSGTNTSTLFNDIVRGLTPGKNTFTWTISNETCSASDNLVVFGLLPPTPYANVDQTICSGTVNLNGNNVANTWTVVDPVPPNPVWQEAIATGYWTSTNPLVTFTNASNFNTTASGISMQTEDAFIWHSVNNFTDYVAGITRTCELVDTMLVYNNSVTSTAGSDIFECGIDLVANSFNLNAVPAVAPMSGVWSQISGPASTILTPASPTTLVTNVFQDNDYIYQWTVSATRNTVTCTAADNMLVEVRIPSNSVVNPSTLEVCVNQAPLVGNIPLSGIGTWSSASGSPGTIDDPSSSVTFVDLIQNGVSQWQWTIDRQGCTSNDIITVTNNTVTADADLALTDPNATDICFPEYVLNATDPDIFNVALPNATGIWLANLGTTTFDNNTVYNTTVRNLSSALPNILTWTITKGSCIESSQLTINNNEFFVDADVNENPNLLETCDGNITLAGEQPGVGGTGFWEIIIGGGTFVNTTLYNTVVITVPKPFSRYVWHVNRIGCNATDTVRVDNNQVFSNAGFDQTVCNNFATLNGGIPNAGELGQWTVTNGGGTVTTPSAYNSGVTNMAQGQNTFVWTISKGNCSAFSSVEIINNEPSDFNVEPDREVCGINDAITVNPGAIGTGVWTISQGGAFTAIVDNTATNTNVTDLQPGLNTFVWTATNGTCTKVGDVTLTNNMVISDAGVPQFVCADSTNLLAAEPSINYPFQGTGIWTVVTGSSTVVTVTAYNSQVISLDPGLNTFRWNMSLGTCTDFDDADVTNNAVQANASNQTVCTDAATFDGNNPGSSNGLWTLVGSSGTPTITTPTLNISTVTGLGTGVNTFRWLVNNAAGCADSIDIQIDNGEFITSAGPDQSLCSTTATMGAQNHGVGYNGYWYVVAGGATVTNSAQFDSPVTGLTPGNNVFRWVVNSVDCMAFDEVIIQNNLPTDAVIVTPIVTNREVCTNSAAVEGTNPVFGIGVWTVSTSILGTYFTNSTSYQTVINDLRPVNNVLTWTISNGTCSSVDQITIVNNEVASVAGSAQTLCFDNTSLAATDPSTIYPNQGTGYWTNISGNVAVITNSLAWNTGVTNLPLGTTTFRWTVEKGICSVFDEVIIANNSATASATNQSDCNSVFTLNGNDPSTFGGTGYWEIVGGGSGTITAPSTQYNTTVTGIPNGVTTTLRWNVDNGTCTDNIEVTVTNNNFSIDAGAAQTICSSNATMNGDSPGTGTGYWTLVSGSGIFSNSLANNTTVSGVGQGTNLYSWTVTRGVCTNSDNVTIINSSPSTAQITGPVITETCDGTISLTANMPSPYYADNQYWQIVSGGGTFNNPSTSFTMDVTNMNPGTNLFQWTIERGICPSSTDVITIVNNEVTAVAGGNQIICSDNTFLNATDPTVIYPNQGIGYWTNLSSNSALITNSLLQNTAVSNLPIGTTTFQWTVELGSCTANDLSQITNSSVTATANNQTGCDGVFTLDGNDPSTFAGTGYWQVIAGSGTITVPSTQYNTTITGVAYNATSALRWTVDNGTCSNSVDITVENTGFPISAGPDVTQCSDTYTFSADDAAPGTGYWTLVGGGGTISNLSQFDAVVSGLPQGSNVFRWTVTRGSCTNFDEITVENTNPDVALITAPGPTNREICSNSVSIQANVPAFGTGQWSVSSGTATFVDDTNFSTVANGLAPGSNTLTWTISNGSCTSSADLIITNSEVASEAGPNQILCADATVLNALNVSTTYPFQGVGHWTNVSSNGAVITNSLAENTAVSNLPVGTTTFMWTVENSICSTNDIVLISNNTVTATALDAQTCNSDILSLTGNTPGPGETGTWTCFTAGVTFDDSNVYNTAAHNLGVGINNFVWTINNADCSTDANIVVTSINPLADAGPDQNNLCDNFTFMGAVNPTPGTGVWSVLSGLGTFADASDNVTYVSGIQQGINTYRWTVTESGCVRTSDVTIINNLPSVGAGSDQSTCNNNVTLSGTNPGGGESGVWNQIAGITAIITNSVQFNTTVTGLSNGANIFEWTISNALCSASDEVTITFNEVIADAGLDNSTCNGTYALMAVDPSPGTGYWEAVGAGTFSDISMFNSNVTGLNNGPNTLRWHQSYAGCSDYDDVVITNNEVSVNAGLDQALCTDNTILVGNNPGATGSGNWTRSGGSGTITIPSFYNSPVTGLSKGINIFTWTITDGPCSNSDEVIINNDEITDVNAGVDQNVCDTYATLAALAPQSGESGYWTVAGGTAVFNNSDSYTTDVTGLVQGDNRLVWTLTNGICNASDTVVVTNNSPTVALVSPDAEICSNIYTLVGNIPGGGESGIWTKEFGASATIVNPTSNITTALSIGAGSNTFRWTISNALCDSYDDIVITNNTITTDAGLDASLCTDTTVLSADNPAPGIGLWTVVNSAGTPIFDNASAYNTIVRNLANGSNIFKWTATKGGCSAWDIVTISNDIPTTADAGPDETVCDGTVNLKANNPSVGTGVWTRLGGAGVIANPSNYNTLVTGLSSGGNTFRWTITEGMCESYSDVLITNELVYASAGMDDNICGNSYGPLNGNQPGAGETGIWTVTGGTGIFANPTLYNTSISGLSQSENVLTWTVTRGSCSNSANVSIFDNTPSPASVSNDQEVCDDFTVIAGNPPTTGVGVWSVAAGSGDFDNSLANTTTVRNIGPDINIFRWTITNGTCTNAADITVTNNSVTAVVGDSIFVCGTDAYLNGNEPTAGQTGVWTRTAGTGIIVNSTLYNTAVTNLNVGINKFRWSISNGTCSAYADLVVTNNLYDATASVAGPTVICVDSADLLGNIPIQGSTGHWEVFAGGGVFDDFTSPTARINNLNKGENTLRWFITKAGCSNFADVSITNNMVSALAGADVITCGNDANLSANELLPAENGLWTLVAGTGTILTPSNNETIITGQSSGVSVYRWTVWGNGCMDDDIVQVNENSFLTEAGPAQTVCNTDATLTGQDPTPGTGIWTTGSGVTINTPTNYITTVTGLQDNSPHTFRWTVSKNGCSSWDEVVITNNLVHAYAGTDQSVCFSNAVLGAQNPVAGNGLWNITSGSGIITTPSYYASTVTGLNAGTITLTWTVSHENCTDADNMIIINNMVEATAGANQAVCADFTNLTGDQAQAGGYGIWTTAGGPGIVQTPSAFNTLVTGLQRGVNTFRWTVYENSCDNGGDLVQVINNTFDAFAGLDQTLNPLQTNTYFNAELLANQTGQWSILSGSGNIHTDTSPTSYVYNMPTGTNIFTWTVHNNVTGCNDDDDVAIIVANFVPYAGEDQVVCVDTAKLNARVETGASSHTWSIVSGGGVFDDIYDSNTVVRGINHGANVYRWTVTFIGYSNYDDVVIFNDSIFVSAGDDVVTCDREHIMNAQQILDPDSVWWSPVGIGGGTIVTNTAWNTHITGLEPGDSYFEWYVSNGNCISRDTVMLHYNLPPIAQFETDPTEFCAPALVTINNTSTAYGGYNIPTEFHWVIEDFAMPNTYDVNDDVLYTFTNTAEWDSIYTIRLVAIDTFTMCTDTFYSTVTASAGPKVEFEVRPNEPQRIPNAIFTFQNKSATDLISYEWDFGNADNRYDTYYVGSFDYEYQIAGTYVVTLEGVSGGQCTGTYTDTVVVLPACPFSWNEGSTVAEGCQELTVEFYNDVYYADNQSFTKWHFYGPNDDVPAGVDRDTSTFVNDPVYTYPEPGNYHPYITAWNASCGSETMPYYTRVDTVIVYTKPIVDFDVAPRLIMLPDQLLTCFNYSEYGDRYFWNFGDSITADNYLEFPQHQYTEPGAYDISLAVWTVNDCFASDTLYNIVYVEEEGSIEFPNAFTPSPNGSNGGVYPCGDKYTVDKDNLNDVFYPKQSGVVTYNLEIYNRWGEKIFVSDDLCVGWDGYVKGVLAPQDVYVWKVSVIYKNGEPERKYGSVTLLR
ncbi:MAG: Ig-like domain-containing protein [Bacteroidales bacterium]|nr:Ig-like domain-containing protein [Bacteroidales bacterium]